MKVNKEIELNFNRNDIEVLFYSKTEGSYFRNSYLKKPLKYTIIFMVAFSILLFLERFDNVHLIFYVFTAPLLIYYLIEYLSLANRLYKYKRSINEWLDYVDSFNRFKISITDESIALSMDEETTIQKWTSIHYCKMDDKKITLKGEVQFLIPAVSMSDNDYNFLRETITERLKTDVL